MDSALCEGAALALPEVFFDAKKVSGWVYGFVVMA